MSERANLTVDGSKAHVAHFEAAQPGGDITHAAEAIINRERELGVIDNVKLHWRAVLISSVAFTAGLAFGYDNVNSGASISMPSFILYFGDMGPTGPFLPSIWTSLWTAMSMVMQAVGAIVVGWPSDKFGRKWPSVGSAALTLVGAAVQYVAVQRASLMGGKMITGFGIGALMATATTYIGEVAPVKLRAPLQTGLVLFVIFTQGLALGVVRVFVPHIEESAFRTVFATQWAVGGMAFLAWLAAPESPVWLIRKGKIDAARKTMQLIYGPNNHADERLEYEIHAIRLEEAKESVNKGSYISCFRGHHLKRTATVAFLYSTHNTGGAAFLAQNIYFLIIAGLEAIHAFDIGIAGFGLAIVIVLSSGVYLQRVSRRNVVLAGLIINFLIMVIIGGLYWTTSNGGLWAIAVLMNILISLQTSMLQGAGWPIAAELPSYHLRAKTLSIGVVSQALTSWLFNFITPYMYNVDSGNLGAKTGFIYAGTSVFLIVGGWYLIPNTTGMTTEEIDQAYEARVSPRNFQSFQICESNRADKEVGSS